MNDLDPNFLVPAWQALVRYFRAYPPLVQGSQQLELPLPRVRSEGCERPCTKAPASLPGSVAEKLTQSPGSYLPKDIERRLPPQPSP